MAETGTTINLTKNVTTADGDGTATKPSDGSKVSAKVAGEKKDNEGIKASFIVNQALSVAKRGVSLVVGNLQGSQLQEQANALVGGVTTVASTITSFAVSPVLGAVNLAVTGAETLSKVSRQTQDRAWSDYGVEEYQRLRGYSGAWNRSRK